MTKIDIITAKREIPQNRETVVRRSSTQKAPRAPSRSSDRPEHSETWCEIKKTEIINLKKYKGYDL